MFNDWVNHCINLSYQPEELNSGSCKILRNVRLDFSFENDIELTDAGYTRNKIKQLERNYLHQPSIDAAVMLWEKYRNKPKYRSVSFTTYNHFIKDHKGPIGSVMGPCLQSVVITMLNRREVDIHVLYRTTEVFKKFPADLYFLRNRLLSQFNFDGFHVRGITCFFTNLTVHPAYYVTILPHLEDPLGELDSLQVQDPRFFKRVIKWLSCYVLPEQHHVIAKFSQALRVQMYAKARITGEELTKLQRYLRQHSVTNDDTIALDDDEE